MANKLSLMSGRHQEVLNKIEASFGTYDFLK
jgi:hypothetical protein